MKDKLIELRERIEKCEKCSFKQDKTRIQWFFEGNEELKGFYGTGIFFVSQRPSTGKSHNSKPRVLRYYTLLKKYGFKEYMRRKASGKLKEHKQVTLNDFMGKAERSR